MITKHPLRLPSLIAPDCMIGNLASLPFQTGGGVPQNDIPCWEVYDRLRHFGALDLWWYACFGQHVNGVRVCPFRVFNGCFDIHFGSNIFQDDYVAPVRCE